MWRTEDDVQQMLRHSATAWAQDAAGPDRFRRFRDQGLGFDRGQWSAMAELGWTGLLLPEDWGGSGLGLDPALTLAEVFGCALVPSPFVASSVVAATLLVEAGEASAGLGAELAAGRLAPLAALRNLGGEGVALAADSLTGRLSLVSGWHEGAPLVVLARDGSESALALVAPGEAGMSLQLHRMADGSIAADIELAATPARVLLRGKAAEAAGALALNREALTISAMLEGLSRRLFDLTADYIRQRVQFEKPLASFQALRHAMVDRYAQIELAGASWRIAARTLAEGRPDATARVAMARARAAGAAHDMGKAAIQYHGAFGYTDDADIGLYVNAILRLASQGGSAATWRNRALARQGEQQNVST